MDKRGLIIVDIQNDFVPNGALAVSEGDLVIPLVNKLMSNYEFIVATQDWHPPTHKSFASNNEGANVGDFIDLDGLTQIMWPDHCIQNTEGAQFVNTLNTESIHHIVQKGKNVNLDSYSGFFDNDHREKTELDSILKENKITAVDICGLALDYCVKFTALDAIGLGYSVRLIETATRAVNLSPADGRQALEDIKNAGGEIIHLL